MLRSVLACTSISLVAAAAWCGEEIPHPARVATLELEASLAKKPGVYLVLDTERRSLEIRARGIVLDSVALTGIELVAQQPLFGGAAPTTLPLPALWTVESGPGDTDREVIAPELLRPYVSEDEEEEETTEDEAEPRRSAPTPSPTPVREPPTSYRARLDSGWDLWITEQLPATSFWGQLKAAVADGWLRLRGRGPHLSPALAVAMKGEDARRLHHLLRAGMPILLPAALP